jgi:CubicO group peptidase (beta-lactamase class C family)
MSLAPPTIDRVDEIVRRTQADCRAPALIAAIVRDGAVAHVSAAGDRPVPHRDLQFRLGSLTKTLTAAVVLGLRDEGRLDLDDRLGEHLTGLAPEVGRVRLRQLLGHAAGLQREPDGPWWERHAGGSVADLLAGIGPAKVAFGPYARFHYSNLAYGLLGALVEHHTGQPWFDVVHQRLLVPLGMERTTYQASEPFAVGYVVHPYHQNLREEPRHDAGAMAPAGQLWSTVDDLARWTAELAGAGRVLSPATVGELAHPVAIADPDAWTGGYGLGLQLWRSGDRVLIGHTGSMPGYLAVVIVHRPSGTGVLALANTYSLPGLGIGRLGLSLVDAVLDLEPPSPAPAWRPVEPPPADVAPLCGRWWWMGREYQASYADGGLDMRPTGPPGDRWRFTPDGPDRWRGQLGEQVGELLTVLRDTDGAVTGLDIATFIFRREPLAD